MIKTQWDYTKLAETYALRPEYAPAAIDAMVSIAEVCTGDQVCDIGAGVGHLTIPLLEREFRVIAVEPNDAMRQRGIERTRPFEKVQWYEATGESTQQEDSSFDLVTFGSSFNVCDRSKALRESARLLKPRRWFACMWNHRNLNDPIQAGIEAIIERALGKYDYGTRREDQTEVINQSNLFGPVVRLEADVVHRQGVDECIAAWRSHGTLQRQAGTKFDQVIDAIEDYLRSNSNSSILVPFTTRIWMAQLKPQGEI
ncbi:MAG: class I SAM-dependent methyltransferase [Pirellula sp.]|jgi:ubiquinone/menaquinone biosynthesis C-methylase UbiE|nr:class I SAM-dependent methyltransferase [Pirellula sp.]